MAEEQPLTRREAEALLVYAEATHRTVTGFRRRIAAVGVVVAVTFGAISGWALLQWGSTRTQIAAVPDDPLIEGLGIRIPDPRPAVQRGELRVRSLLWAVVALGSGVVALLGLGLFLLVRPAPLPPGLRDRPVTAPRAPPG